MLYLSNCTVRNFALFVLLTITACKKPNPDFVSNDEDSPPDAAAVGLTDDKTDSEVADGNGTDEVDAVQDDTGQVTTIDSDTFIVDRTPTIDNNAVELDDVVSITFAASIDSSLLGNKAIISLRDAMGAVVSGTEQIDENKVIFTPDHVLNRSMTYTASANVAATAFRGDRREDVDVSWSFIGRSGEWSSRVSRLNLDSKLRTFGRIRSGSDSSAKLLVGGNVAPLSRQMSEAEPLMTMDTVKNPVGLIVWAETVSKDDRRVKQVWTHVYDMKTRQWRSPQALTLPTGQVFIEGTKIAVDTQGNLILLFVTADQVTLNEVQVPLDLDEEATRSLVASTYDFVEKTWQKPSQIDSHVLAGYYKSFEWYRDTADSVRILWRAHPDDTHWGIVLKTARFIGADQQQTLPVTLTWKDPYVEEEENDTRPATSKRIWPPRVQTNHNVYYNPYGDQFALNGKAVIWKTKGVPNGDGNLRMNFGISADSEYAIRIAFVDLEEEKARTTLDDKKTGWSSPYHIGPSHRSSISARAVLPGSHETGADGAIDAGNAYVVIEHGLIPGIDKPNADGTPIENPGDDSCRNANAEVRTAVYKIVLEDEEVAIEEVGEEANEDGDNERAIFIGEQLCSQKNGAGRRLIRNDEGNMLMLWYSVFQEETDRSSISYLSYRVKNEAWESNKLNLLPVAASKFIGGMCDLQDTNRIRLGSKLILACDWDTVSTDEVPNSSHVISLYSVDLAASDGKILDRAARLVDSRLTINSRSRAVYMSPGKWLLVYVKGNLSTDTTLHAMTLNYDVESGNLNEFNDRLSNNVMVSEDLKSNYYVRRWPALPKEYSDIERGHSRTPNTIQWPRVRRTADGKYIVVVWVEVPRFDSEGSATKDMILKSRTLRIADQRWLKEQVLQPAWEISTDVHGRIDQIDNSNQHVLPNAETVLSWRYRNPDDPYWTSAYYIVNKSTGQLEAMGPAIGWGSDAQSGSFFLYPDGRRQLVLLRSDQSFDSVAHYGPIMYEFD